jgi:uncharacterized protein YneF (UPF0154 family)
MSLLIGIAVFCFIIVGFFVWSAPVREDFE